KERVEVDDVEHVHQRGVRQDPALPRQLRINAEVALDVNELAGVGESIGDAVPCEPSHLGVDEVTEPNEQYFREYALTKRSGPGRGTGGTRGARRAIAGRYEFLSHSIDYRWPRP